MEKVSLENTSSSDLSYATYKNFTTGLLDLLVDDSDTFPSSWSFRSLDPDDSSEPPYDTSWCWFVPSLWASQWTAKTQALLELSSVSMSICPLCVDQGPEWARVVQEPPFSVQILPSDFSSGRKVVLPYIPTWRLMDWEDLWARQQGPYCFRPRKEQRSLVDSLMRDQELLAATVGNLEWLHHCLKNEKEIHVDCRGFTALHLATKRGHLNCIRALVEQYKFPLERTTNKGWTVLHLAIRKENPAVSLKCLEYLLKKGAPVNVQNRNGLTALHLAAGEGMLNCLKALVNAGADVHALDNQNQKGIDLCRAWNHRECARYLKDAMWKQDKKELAGEMSQLKQLKRQLLIMQNKYLLEKKKEKEAQNQVAFTKWLQTKALPRLPKIQLREPAPVCKEPAQIRKAPSHIPKAFPHITKEAPQVKKCSQVTKPQPQRRPHPPSTQPPTLAPPAQRRFRPLKKIKPPSNVDSALTILPSLSPIIPSHRPSSSPLTRSNPAAPTSPAPCHSPLAPSVSSSRGSTRSKSSSEARSGDVSTSARRVPKLHRAPGSPSSLQHPSKATLRRSRESFHSLHPCEAQPSDSQKHTPNQPAAPVLSQHLVSLLDIYLADIPLGPPPARPSSPFCLTTKWNSSTKLETKPATQIALPQGVRLGVHPDRVPEPDFNGFLKFTPNGEGGVHIQTVEGQWLFPVPRLPYPVLLRELCPSLNSWRIKVPEELRSITILDLPRRRYPGDQCFWTDSMAMSLRDTFDPTFINLVRKHQGLSPLSSSSSPASSPSSMAPRQCWTFLFCSLNDPL